MGAPSGENTKELSYILSLYYRAKELQINIGQAERPDEYILMDDDTNQS